MNSNLGAFGYVKYDASTRKNPHSLDLSLCDIYDHICPLDEWSDDIKQSQIKISDMIINNGFFSKTKFNIKPWIFTNHQTDIIHPVKNGFYKVGIPGCYSKKWYDADAESIIFPENLDEYRELAVVFPPYNNHYIEAIFNGHNIKYSDPIPGIDF